MDEETKSLFHKLGGTIVFPIVMYEFESWTLKKVKYQRIDAFEPHVVLEKTLQSPLDSKEIKAVNPKGNQPCVFIGRADDETLLCPLDARSQLTGKDPDAEKD